MAPYRATLFLAAAVIAASPVSAADEQAGGPIKDGYGRKITNSNKNQVIFYGIATRALLYADDGDRHQLLNVDGGVENTRVGWIATGKVNENVTVIGHVEMDTQLSNRVSSVNLNGTEGADENEWGVRIQEVAIDHKKFGKLSLGQGNTASTDRVVIDLSGTALANGNNPADMAGGIHFFNRTDRTRTVTIGDVFDKIDGIDKDDRVRYDLPEFGGFNLGFSHTGGGAWDVGAGYAAEVGALTMEAAAFYAQVAGTSDTQKDMWGGSGSIKHKSGLSLTVAGAVRNQKFSGGDNARYLWGKVGYSVGLRSYGEYKNFSQNGDRATSVGLGIVQDFESIGSHIWLLVRNHELSQSNNNDFHDVFVVSLGTLLNF
ncbi:MAG: hypothetical protein HYY38_05210 [Rhodospirillales bacterium]|nr:hypothetical protein [Rhodospirillales bacterium]